MLVPSNRPHEHKQSGQFGRTRVARAKLRTQLVRVLFVRVRPVGIVRTGSSIRLLTPPDIPCSVRSFFFFFSFSSALAPPLLSSTFVVFTLVRLTVVFV